MIRITDLHKSFDNNPVLRGVNLDVATGQSLVIIGGSGTGKSVLFKCILGLETPDRGAIHVNGHDVTHTDRAPLLRTFGMLFQGAALFDGLPVWENVIFRLARSGLSKHALRDLAIAKLRQVGLGVDVADKFPAALSGGMQKRVGLARAIAADPKIIFFDEPTTGLDPIMAGVINGLIRDIVDETQATAITITHDMTTVNAVADRVAMLHDGVVQWHGDTVDLRHSNDPYLSQFISGNPSGPIPTLR